MYLIEYAMIFLTLSGRERETRLSTLPRSTRRLSLGSVSEGVTMTFKTLPDTNRPLYLSQIAQLYTEARWSCSRIGGRYKRSTEAVETDLKDAGVKLRSRGWHCLRDWTKDGPRAVQWYHEGQTVRQIARRLDSTIAGISEVLRAHGVHPMTAPERRRSEIATHVSSIIDGYRQGASLDALKRRYHLSHSVLVTVLESHGVEIRPASTYPRGKRHSARERNPKLVTDMVKAYCQDGWSVERIAKHHQVDESAVSAWLKENGVKIDPYRRGRLTEAQEQEAVRRYSEGQRLVDIQRSLGVRYQALRRALVGRGVTIRTPLQTNTRRFGYIGTYRHFLFRSLMELSFVLDHEGEHHVESAEGYGIAYRHGGRKRTYYPDFLLDHTRLVELKPDSYRQDPCVLAKARAAKVFCKRQGWEYVLTDWPVDKARIARLVQTGVVCITNRSPEQVAAYLGFPHAV